MSRWSANIVLAYARVSSSYQRSDLETQRQRLAEYCAQNFANYLVISDLGSGLNFKKPGLKKPLHMIFVGQVSHLVINHKDRLLRFGSELIFQHCQHFGIQVIVLEETLQQNFEQELVDDVIQLMTVFLRNYTGRDPIKIEKS